nr:integrase, catalytic region, zinc finger, CCHC-type, peptidase aspartic, catalytic [Tanacetum cinerariifolium]
MTSWSSELTEVKQLQDNCDIQATNIILHGLPLDVYALINHQEEAKDIWDKVKLLMKGTKLSYQEREGHRVRQCTQLKRPRNSAWFKEKVMLAKTQEDGETLDEEQLAFLSDPGIEEDQFNTPKITTQWNTTLGCYFIVHTRKLQQTTSKETFLENVIFDILKSEFTKVPNGSSKTT